MDELGLEFCVQRFVFFDHAAILVHMPDGLVIEAGRADLVHHGTLLMDDGIQTDEPAGADVCGAKEDRLAVAEETLVFLFSLDEDM